MPSYRLGEVDDARGLASHGAKLSAVQDTVDAAVRVVETRGPPDRAAFRTSAFGSLEGAAGFAVVVYAFVADDAVAAGRLAWN